MVTTVTGSRTTSLFTDNDTDGKPDPNDVLLTQIQINNIGAEAALTLTVDDNFTGSTLVPGSVTITPIAYDDGYGLTGNTPITFSAGQGVLLNDIDPDGAEINLTVTKVNGTNIGGTINVANGTVAMSADGSFTFTPTTGFVGVTSFQYTIQDEQGLNNVTTGVVTLTVTGKVWYVDNTYGGENGASDGSYLKPFTQFTQLNGLNGDGSTNDDVDGSGDSIFAYHNGAAYTTGITLEASQTLLGDGQSFLVNGHNIGGTERTGGVDNVATNSVIDNAGANGGITLSTDNVIKGLTINGTASTAIGIQDGNGSVGNLVVDKVSLTGTGQAVDIDQGGNLTVHIDTLSSSGAGTNMQGVQLAGTASSGAGLIQGTFTADAGTIQTASDHDFQIGTGAANSGGTIAVTYGGNISTSINGSAVFIGNRLAGSGNINFNGTIFQDSGASSTTDGIAITTVAAGNINFTGTKTIDTTGTNLNAISVIANSGAVVNFSGGALNLDMSNGNGFAISQSAGQVNVSTAADIDATGTGRGISITGSTGGAVNFTGGGLTITTSAGTALHDNNASTGSSLTISGSGNTLATTGGGALVDIANVGSSGLTFDTLNASSSVTNNNAININNLDGGTWTSNTITVAGTTGATSDGLKIQGGSSTVFNLGTVTISNTGDDGIELNGANGTVSATSVNIQNTAGQGLDINGATAAVTISGGTIGTTNDTTLEGVLITGGNAAVTVNAAITKTSAGNIVEIQGHSSATVAFGGTLSATGGFDNGILINSSSGTINFSSATKTISTGASNAVNITTNAASVNFQNGGLDIDTTTGTGFSAIGGGTVSITGTGNHINVGAARAFTLDGTASAGVTLENVGVSGGGSSTGIYLNNAGTGGFTITGIGTTAGTGGTITNISGTNGQATTGVGLYANNTDNISLSNMNFTGPFGNYAIKGLNVTNFTLRDSNLSGTLGNDDVTENEAGIWFTNLDGIGLFEGNNISGGYTDNLRIETGAGTLNLFVRDTAAHQAVFGNNGTTTAGNDSLSVEMSGNANLFALVEGVSFTGWRGDGVAIQTIGTANSEITIKNNTFVNNHPLIASAGGIGVLIDGTGGGSGWSVDYSITGNTFTGSKGYALAASFVGASGMIRGFIDNNTIGTPNGTLQLTGSTTGSSEAGGMFINIEKTFGSAGILEHYVTITNNTIRDVAHMGIYVRSTNGGAAPADYAITEATIKNNNIDEMFSTSGAAIRGLAGGNDPDTGRVGLDLQNNVLNADTTADSYGAVFLDQIFGTNALFTLPTYPGNDFAGENYGSGNASTDVMNYLTGRGNTLTASTANNLSFPGVTVYALDAKLSGAAFTHAAPTGSDVQLPTGALQLPADPGPDPIAAGTPAGDPAAGSDDTQQTSSQGGETAVPVDDGGAAAPAGGTPPPAIVDDDILTQGEVDLLVDAAIQRWADAGASPDQLAAMRAVSVSVSDMMGLYVGSTTPGQIRLDSDGGGYGWFLDATPGEDSEYEGAGTRLTADQGGAAEGKIDLLTVIMHELGHQIGLSDDYNLNSASELMYGYMHPGERRLPGGDDAQGAVPGSLTHEEFALSPAAVVGTLPVGKSVIVAFKSVVNSFGNQVIPDYFNTGTISGSNFPTVNTNTETLDIDTLTLGDRIFIDVNKNGVYDAGTDTGVVGVTLTLYADSNGSGALDGAELTTVIATATTGAGGVYTFPNLAPGDYVVSVDASNFAGAAPLFGKVSIAGGTDPDDNIDHDDNGVAGPSGTIISAPIRLDYNQEPTAGTGNDTNNTLDFGFIAPNQAPTSNNFDSDIAAYVEGAAPVKLDVGGNATLSDDNANFNNGTLTVAIGAGAVTTEDVLSIGTTAAVTLGAGSTVLVNGTSVGTYTGGTNGNALVITMNANATAARMQDVLRALQYNNTNLIDPGTDTRAVSITLVDGGGTDGGLGADTLVLNTLVNVTPVNDEPAGADNGDTTTDAQTLVFDAANFSTGFTDPDHNLFDGVTITTLPATGKIKLNNVDISMGAVITLAQLNGGELTFVPTLGTGNTAPTFTFQVHDNGGVLNSGVDTDQSPNTFTITITPSDIAPVVDLNGTNDAGNDYASAYTEGGAAAVIADTDVLITDADAGDQVEGATITITDAIAGDQLTIVGALPGAIMAVGGGTATITLSGTGSQAEYQQALTQIRYSSTSDNPTAAGTDGSRSVTVTVTDGDLSSVARTTTVTVTGVNDAPVNVVGAPAATNEDTSVVLSGISVSDADIDPATTPISVGLSVDHGTLVIRTDVAGGITGANIVAGANGTDTIVVIATQDQINATLANATGLTYTPAADYNGADDLTVITNDLGANGTDPGGPDPSSEQDTDIKVINIAAISDAPNGGDRNLGLQEDATHVFAAFDFDFTDPKDGDDFAAVYFASAPTGGKIYLDTDGPGGNAPVELTYPATVPLSEITAGHLTFVPTLNSNGNGAAVIMHQVIDDGSNVPPNQNMDQSAGTLTFDITAVNDPPAGADATITGNEDAFRLLAQADFGFTDVDTGDAFSAVTITGVTGGKLYFDSDGPGGADPVEVLTFPQTYTAADLSGGKVLYKGNLNLNGTGVGTISFQVIDNSGAVNNTDPSANTLSVNLNPINDHPDIPNSPTINATEQVPIKINAAITVSDVDLDARNGGNGDYTGAAFAINRTVSNAEDFFSFDTSGALFTVNGSNLEVGGVVIATLAQSGGILNINFVNNGTVPTTALANDVLRHLQYTNTSDSPPASVTLIYIIDDGAPGGGQGTVVSGNDIDGGQVTINITDTEEAPIVDLNGAGAGTGNSIAYTENNPPALLAPAATVSDLDSPDFDTGVLTVEFTANGESTDQLVIVDSPTQPNPIGFGTGDISHNENQIFYYPDDLGPEVEVASYTGGDNGTPLVITFNANATAAIVQAVVRSIGYSADTNDPSASQRNVTFTLSDGDGNTSSPVIAMVNVTPVEDQPIAQDDSFATNEDTAIVNGNLFADNGNGIDVDPDGPPPVMQVTAVNGVPGAVGTQITLASGAKLTVRADGTFDYDPNDKFNTLTSESSGETGAVNTAATETFTYTLAGGDTATVTIVINGVISPEDRLDGDSGDNVITGTPGPDFFFVPQGGNDDLSGLGGNDVFLFGATLTSADKVDGGPGVDQIAIQGNYAGGVTLGTQVVSVESLVLLPSSDNRFGGGSGTPYDYNVTTVNENVAAGALLTIDASRLQAGEDFTFNGSAETDGKFFIYGGLGADDLTGGAKNDVFLFGEAGQWGAADKVVGGLGTDQLALRGDYTIAFGAGQLTGIESIALVSAHDTRFGALGADYDYNLTMNNGNVASGQQMTVDGAPLRADETLTFDGSAELDGSFRVFGGAANDVIHGSQGADILSGGLGADMLYGNAGNDVFLYRSAAESTSASRDRIFDFTLGDKVDLSKIDAIAGTPGDDSFTFIGANGFSGVAGQLRYENTTGNTWVVQGDTNGDGIADIELVVVTSDSHPLTPVDFYG